MDTHKTIIITGTSSGIGFTLAEYFGKQGHHVYGLSRKFVESPHLLLSQPILLKKNK